MRSRKKVCRVGPALNVELLGWASDVIKGVNKPLFQGGLLTRDMDWHALIRSVDVQRAPLATEHLELTTPNRGFTLIEVILAVVVLGLVGFIAVPQYLTMHERASQAMLIENMRLLQLACETYALDFNGYPSCWMSAMESYGCYFPDGDEQRQTKTGLLPKNPCTGRPMSPNDFETFTYSGQYDHTDTRLTGCNDVQLTQAGNIRYGRFSFTGRWPWKHYGIIGARKDRWSIRDTKILVFHD